MKKLIALLLAAVMLLAMMTGCANKDNGAAETTAAETTEAAELTLEEIKAQLTTKDAGKLTVATSPDFAPYEFYAINADGDPVLSGFDMALAQYIADYLGLELEVIPMDFDGVLMEVGNKSVDLGMAGLSPDPERADAMDFSDIYYEGGQSFVTIKDKAELFTSLEDANNADYSIGAQIGSIQYGLAEDNTPDADLVALTKVTDIIQELLTGKLDGAFIETVVAESYAVNYPELTVVLDVPYEVAGSAIGVAKGNAVLLAGINMAIAAALEDGSMDKFVADANELATGEIIEGLIEE